MWDILKNKKQRRLYFGLRGWELRNSIRVYTLRWNWPLVERVSKIFLFLFLEKKIQKSSQHQHGLFLVNNSEHVRRYLSLQRCPSVDCLQLKTIIWSVGEPKGKWCISSLRRVWNKKCFRHAFYILKHYSMQGKPTELTNNIKSKNLLPHNY